MSQLIEKNLDNISVDSNVNKANQLIESVTNYADSSFVSSQYLPILIFLIIAIGLSILILVIPFIVNKMRPNFHKNSPYECGFEGVGPVRNEFKVQFYLVAILFIIFDLEVAFLFPWAIVLKEIGLVGFYSMMVFLLILTIGFIYEWKRGALEWK